MRKKSSNGRNSNGRFMSGHSGNLAGRPPSEKSVNSAIAKAYAEKVPVTENGKRRKVSKLEITAKQIANRSAAGDPRMVKIGLDLARKGEEHDALAASQPRQLSETDQEIAERLVARIERIVEERIRGGNTVVD